MRKAIAAAAVVLALMAALCACAAPGASPQAEGDSQSAAHDLLDSAVSGVFANLHEDWRVYAGLGDEDKRKYLVLYDVYRNRSEREYPTDDMDDFARIRDCVLADHPELFFVVGGQMRTTTSGAGDVVDVTVSGTFSCTPEEAQGDWSRVEEAAARCLAGMPADADDYGKAKYLYEWLSAHVEYDHDAVGAAAGETPSQSAVGALVYGRAVCSGYAQAYQLMMEQSGIPCMYVTGDANGGLHAWCAARLDGAWYHIDPTWGDPQFMAEDGAGSEGRLSYDYLCVTDADIAATHVVTCPYAIPPCTQSNDNYYVREGLYLTEADVEAAGAIVASAAERGEASARLRCSDRSVYDQLVEALFDGQEILRFIPGDSCSYALGDAMCTIEVIFDA